MCLPVAAVFFYGAYAMHAYACSLLCRRGNYQLENETSSMTPLIGNVEHNTPPASPSAVIYFLFSSGK